jgi:hypothetical protein
VNGKSPAAGGDGSQAHPWNSVTGIIGGSWGASGFSVPGYTRPLLSSVPYGHSVAGKGRVVIADQIGNPPVQPGDAIYLLSGNYGDISIGDFHLQTANSDWVTVEAAPIPGVTPVFDTLGLGDSNKWVFNGIKVQSLLGTNNNRLSLVTIGDQGSAFPTSDIIFTNMQISTADSTAGWTQAQWRAQSRSGFREVGTPGNGTNGEPFTTCISMTGSHIQNVSNAAVLAANKSLFSNNQIDHFGDDGIDYAASNLAIMHNNIHDNLDIGDGNHADAMQGQNGPVPAGVAYNAFSNIVIDSNLIIRQTDPKLAFPTYLQGIDAFDEDWTNVTVTNNVIITSGCTGIAISSVHNGLIANNTVLEDGLVVSPGCTVMINAGGSTHQGLPSDHVRVTNNLAEHFSIGNENAPTVTYDHNVALSAYEPFVHWQGTTPVYSSPVPVDAFGNVAFAPSPGDQTLALPEMATSTLARYQAQFQAWNPATLTFNVMLKAASQAIGAGTAGAPTVDIIGASRLAPYTAGAYSYPF